MHQDLTQHAEMRARQRGIPPLIIDWLRDYGAVHYDKLGAEIRYFNKQSRRELERLVGHEVIGRLRSLLDSYIVEKDGVVITVGRRYKRLVNH